MSRTRERSEKSLGAIDALSISVILNYKKVVVRPPDSLEAARPQVTFEPYANTEISEIEAIVKNAVGFQEERSDRFAIHQTQFDTSDDFEMDAELLRQRRQEQNRLYIRYGLMAVALVLATLLIRSASRRLQSVEEEERQVVYAAIAAREAQHLAGASGEAGQLEAGGTSTGLLEPPEELNVTVDDFYASKLTREAKVRLKAKHLMFDEIKEQVINRPETTADVLRSWLAEDAQKNS